ncbi:HotDog domain-containing protein [Chaetomium sp. MPI-SDFR-AT-0129]|nr:HotDog domain-containing protein [Chaetomium sp. MPI-SDFR-AT-0129]
MVPRIPYRQLVRVASSPWAAPTLSTRLVATSRTTTPIPFAQSLSTSSIVRQEPKQPQHPPLSQQPTDPLSSTATTTTKPVSHPPMPSQPEPQPDQQQPPNPQKPRSRWRPPSILLAIGCTILGLSAGTSARLLLSPPTPPEPHTEEDAYTTRVLHDQAAKLPVVQLLTAGVAAGEYESWDAYESLSPEQRAQHISAGALAGSRGVGGYQKVFWNKATGELVSVIFFGPATTGWPGVVHGGCLATILDESCGRAAFKDKEWGGRAGMTAKLGLEYKKVTMANGFYVVRVRVKREEELPEEERGKRHYKCWVVAQVEDAVTGAVNVTADALFVGGKGKKAMVLGGVLGGEKAKAGHMRF